MLIRLILLACLTIMLGCSASDVSPPPEGISQDQLVPALAQIAETGQFEEKTLLELTVGLEQAGLMGEAASVQQLPSLSNEKQVKQFAKKLSAAVKKQLAAGNR